MIVVDTNIVAYYCLGGAMGARADALRMQERIWLAPPIWQSEFRNVLAGEMRRSGMGLAMAEEAYETARRAVRTCGVEAGDVLRMAKLTRCTAYDLEFVALAKRAGVALYTQDGELLRNFPEIARALPGI